MMELLSLRFIMALTATQPVLLKGEIVGDSIPGVSLQASSRVSCGISYSTIAYLRATRIPRRRPEHAGNFRVFSHAFVTGNKYGF